MKIIGAKLLLNFGAEFVSRVVFMPNIPHKSCYYLFILLPAKGCNFHM